MLTVTAALLALAAPIHSLADNAVYSLERTSDNRSWRWAFSFEGKINPEAKITFTKGGGTLTIDAGGSVGGARLRQFSGLPDMLQIQDLDISWNTKVSEVIPSDLGTYRVDISINAPTSARPYWQHLQSMVDSGCVVQETDIPELIEALNKEKNADEYSKIKVGSCGIVIKSSLRKYLKKNQKQNYTTLIECLNRVTQSDFCNARFEYKGWGVQYNFDLSQLTHHDWIEQRVISVLLESTIEFDPFE